MSRQFTATRCEVSESRGDDEWQCDGSFTADDRSFDLPEVEVDTTFATKPTGPVAVYVDDESSTTAVERDKSVWLYPGATGLLCLGVGAWNVRSALSRPKEEPAAAPV